jgi:glycosyltransferase involved in cell wall biosynthesis
MRVLLAAKFMPTGPRPIGGVQSWVATVVAELRRRGFEVVLWQPGFPALGGRFDLGILANWAHTAGLADACDRVLVVSHGIIPEERPPASVRVAFTSEGVREHWGLSGPIVRQPIDLDFWSPASGREPVLVRYSYRGGLPWLPEVAQALRLGFHHLRNVSHEQARDKLRGAACVLATGRAALEAMACGVPVVICDHRSAYQGPLLDFDVAGAIARNYSGRGGVEARPDSVSEAICEAIEQGSRRSHVEKHHNAGRVVDQLLEAACSSC